MAQNKLKFAPTSNAFSTNLNGSISDTATTITLNSVTGLQNKAGILVIDRQDADGNNTDSKREYIYFTSVAGSAVVLPDVSDGRGQGGSTGQSHADGSVVEAIMDVDQYNGLIDSYDAQHNDNGTHDDVTSDTLVLSETLNVASAASIVGPVTLGNLNLPSTASGFYQIGKPVILANISDQTLIGRNEVRATRFVPVTPPVTKFTGDPADTNFTHDVDVSGQTSSTAYAASIRGQLRSTTVGKTLHVRKNGDSDAQDLTTQVNRVVSTSVPSTSNFIVELDASQIFEWGVNSVDVDSLILVIDGYWEYVD